MKNSLLAMIALAGGAVLAGWQSSGIGHAQQPGGGTEPFSVPFAKPAEPAMPAYLPTTPGYQKIPAPASAPAFADTRQAAPFQPQDAGGPKSNLLTEYLSEQIDVSINNDIAVNDKCGEWLICLNCYSGKDAPVLARALAVELRNNPDYRLHAFVYTKGAEERRADVERIIHHVNQQREINEKNGTPDKPIRVPMMRCEIQCTVLVGGYRDMAAARHELERIKKLKELDYKKIRVQCVAVPGGSGGKKGDQALEGEYRAINPFLTAMVVRNPALASTRPNGYSAEDIALMKALNEKETLSVLNCPKKYTLAVKQISLGIYKVEDKKTSSGLFGLPNLFGSEPKEDQALLSARNLAGFLRNNCKLEAYVLHTKYCSYVTVGGYDRPDDPRLVSDQQLLQQLNASLREEIKLVPRAVVMEIPR